MDLTGAHAFSNSLIESWWRALKHQWRLNRPGKNAALAREEPRA
jgi:hypothetical protein